MVQRIGSLAEIAPAYDAIVLDQWGVLHDGTHPYPHAIAALKDLHKAGHPLAVLSNSGKRSDHNQKRIENRGFPPGLFRQIMSSGEALWRDIASGKLPERVYFAVERRPREAQQWAEGLDIELTPDMGRAEAVLLMGLPDGSSLDDWRPMLDEALAHRLPVYCSNPDRASVRSGGVYAMQPGALAYAYAEMGGQVSFYGKPYLPIFTALQSALGQPDHVLMVGDSMEHDIGGANGAGWDSLFVCGGIHKLELGSDEVCARIDELAASKGVTPPAFAIEELK
ncbi:MAG: TIGR01459 family HAD-type hydrolase [Rhodobacter sp.]|nr:TIGR01459 family HAD-type hydrolase [Rhodobacter sp.]